MKEKAFCQLATLMPDGSPQITQVWIDTDGQHILINAAQDRQKTRNMRRDPRVAVNVVDPNNAWRLGAVRGRVVDITTDGADDHIDQMATKYRGLDKYPNRRPDEQRVIVKILPEKVREVGLDN